MRYVSLFLLSFFPHFILSQSVQFSFGRDTVFVEPGEVFETGLRILPFKDAVGFQGSIRWDTTLLQLSDALPAAITPTKNIDNNTLSYIWTNATGISLPDSTPVLRLRFRAGIQYPEYTKIELPEALFIEISGNDLVARTVETRALTVVIRRCSVALDLGTDLKICSGQPAPVVTPFCMGCSTFSWDDGSSLRERPLNAVGPYTALAKAPLQCFARDTVRYDTLPLPVFQLQSTLHLCPAETASTQIVATDQYNWLWSTGATTRDISISTPATYTLRATDKNQCRKTGTLTVTQDGPQAETQVTPPRCGVATGIVAFRNVTGGIAPYLYQLDDEPLRANPLFGQILPGTHIVVVEDSNGCQWQDSVLVPLFIEPVVRLTASKTTVSRGDSLLMRADLLNYPPDSIAFTAFFPKGTFSQTGKALEIWAKPSAVTRYTVRITSKSGCTASDSLIIKVVANGDLKIYAPTVFSPHTPGGNHLFKLSTSDPHVKSIGPLQIFDRWGNLVAEGKMWDGVFASGQPAESGIYIWSTNVEADSPAPFLLSGEVLLIR